MYRKGQYKYYMKMQSLNDYFSPKYKKKKKTIENDTVIAVNYLTIKKLQGSGYF